MVVGKVKDHGISDQKQGIFRWKTLAMCKFSCMLYSFWKQCQIKRHLEMFKEREKKKTTGNWCLKCHKPSWQCDENYGSFVQKNYGSPHPLQLQLERCEHTTVTCGTRLRLHGLEQWLSSFSPFCVFTVTNRRKMFILWPNLYINTHNQVSQVILHPTYVVGLSCIWFFQENTPRGLWHQSHNPVWTVTAA